MTEPASAWPSDQLRVAIASRRRLAIAASAASPPAPRSLSAALAPCAPVPVRLSAGLRWRPLHLRTPRQVRGSEVPAVVAARLAASWSESRLEASRAPAACVVAAEAAAASLLEFADPPLVFERPVEPSREPMPSSSEVGGDWTSLIDALNKAATSPPRAAEAAPATADADADARVSPASAEGAISSPPLAIDEPGPELSRLDLARFDPARTQVRGPPPAPPAVRNSDLAAETRAWTAREPLWAPTTARSIVPAAANAVALRPPTHVSEAASTWSPATAVKTLVATPRPTEAVETPQMVERSWSWPGFVTGLALAAAFGVGLYVTLVGL